jgi:hypothetical protein
MNTPEFKFSCPYCGQHLLCENDLAGREIQCPGCQQPLLVPRRCLVEPLQPDGAVPVSADAWEGESRSEINPSGRSLAVLRFRYCFYGALLGALALSILSQFYHLLAMVLLGAGDGAGGWAASLFAAVGKMVLGALFSPWGLLGGVAGAWWASHKLNARLRETPPVAVDTQTSETAEAEGSILRRGEVPLACGLGLVVPTAYLLPQVMLGLLALPLVPAVVALLLIGVLRARSRFLAPGWQAIGIVLLLLAVGGLLLATLQATETSARQARLAQIRQNMHGQWPAERIEAEMQSLARHPAYAPPPRGGIRSAALWLAPLCMWLGLLCWAGWSQWRCLFWAGVVWGLPYGIARLIQAFGASMVLSA